MTTSYAMDMAELENSGLRNLINLLPGIVILLDEDREVVYFSADAAILGLVRDREITLKELSKYVKSLKPSFIKANTLINHYNKENKITQQLDIDAIQIEQGFILLLITDQTFALRIEQTRRDFIANISHELKTPVSALELLSEAIKEADKDTESIKKFAEKIPNETKRLANLIKDIIDLSRIQSDNPLEEPEI
ncbi:MAG: histidine kinase dimerization/phospho-acceptor domain-containing protein, partial [Actinomycetes bacterium]